MARSLLLGCQAITKAYGARTLFDGLSFGLVDGDQVGLVGPNGSGKSTLLEDPGGHREARPRHRARSAAAIRVGYVPQDPVFPAGRHRRGGDRGRPARGGRGRAPRDGSPRPSAAPGSTDGRAAVDTLSGGWRKRLAIARELAARARRAAAGRADQPPRPRRHPLAGGLLADRARAVLVVSHDRYFLEHVADPHARAQPRLPGRALPGRRAATASSSTSRDEFLRGQAAYEESLANTRAARDRVAAARGAKARTTKAQGAASRRPAA